MSTNATVLRLAAVQHALEMGRCAQATLRAAAGRLITETSDTPVPPARHDDDTTRARVARFVAAAAALGVVPPQLGGPRDDEARVRLLAAELLRLESELRHELDLAGVG